QQRRGRLPWAWRHRLLATSPVKMEAALTASSVSGGVFFLPFPFPPRRRSVGRRPGLLPVFRASSKDGPELDKWDLMELKFGRLLGEDPKLTLAKVKTRSTYR
ncbi:hypothetical protein B296_00037218, partial [Ensete ventricosum]